MLFTRSWEEISTFLLQMWFENITQLLSRHHSWQEVTFCDHDPWLTRWPRPMTYELLLLPMVCTHAVWNIEDFDSVFHLQVCVQLPTASHLLLWAQPYSNQSISPARRAFSSKRATAATEWWDRQTDARQFHRPCSAYYASSVNRIKMSAGRPNY